MIHIGSASAGQGGHGDQRGDVRDVDMTAFDPSSVCDHGHECERTTHTLTEAADASSL